MVFSCICDIVICQLIKEITKEEAWKRRSKRAGEIFRRCPSFVAPVLLIESNDGLLYVGLVRWASWVGEIFVIIRRMARGENEGARGTRGARVEGGGREEQGGGEDN